MLDVIVPSSALYRPLFPEDLDQGDPFIFAPPPQAQSQFPYYVYTTGEDPVSGRAFPVYASHDLVTWQRLDDALAVEVQSSHWAPCVTYLPQLDLPYVMLYSRVIGVGEEGHVGPEVLQEALATPEGQAALGDLGNFVDGERTGMAVVEEVRIV